MPKYESFRGYQDRAGAEFRKWATSGEHVFVLHEIHGSISHAAEARGAPDLLEFQLAPAETWTAALDVHGERFHAPVAASAGRWLRTAMERGMRLPCHVNVDFGEGVFCGPLPSVGPAPLDFDESARAAEFVESRRRAWVGGTEPYVRSWARESISAWAGRGLADHTVLECIRRDIAAKDGSFSTPWPILPAEWRQWIDDEFQTYKRGAAALPVEVG